MINIRLHNMDVLQFARSCEGCFDGITQINAYYVACTPICGQLCMTTLAAAAFQHNLVLKKLGLHRRDPSQKLIRIEFVALDEMLPLPTKILGGGGFVGREVIRRAEARDTAKNRIRTLTESTRELTFDDLSVFG